jgi:transcriptional regulator GlxA family with amidase domain
MHFQISFPAAILSLSVLSFTSGTLIACVPRDQPILRSYGILLYRAFDPLDIFGPLEILQAVSRNYTLQLHLLSRTLSPVLGSPLMPSMNPTNSSFFPTLLPTDTFTSNPDIDVLIVPGGAGMRNPNMTEEIEYVKAVYPKLRYVITVCTGSAFLARTGLLDGRRATTNKESWKGVVGYGPNVRWVSPARWVVDGNIWSSAGVSISFF